MSGIFGIGVTDLSKWTFFTQTELWCEGNMRANLLGRQGVMDSFHHGVQRVSQGSASPGESDSEYLSLRGPAILSLGRGNPVRPNGHRA